MSVIPRARVPELERRGECPACGGEIGWVRLPGEHWRAVDPRPHRMGEYALLRDGLSALSLRDRERFAEEFDRGYSGPRFFDHGRTCPVPAVRTLHA